MRDLVATGTATPKAGSLCVGGYTAKFYKTCQVKVAGPRDGDEGQHGQGAGIREVPTVRREGNMTLPHYAVTMYVEGIRGRPE